jgi:hypothetical protein
MNTEFGNWLLCYSWLLATAPLGYSLDQTWRAYEKNVVGFTYGDDLTSAVSPEFAKIFNQASHAANMKSIGVIFTPAVKDAIVSAINIPIEDESFLGGTTHEEVHTFSGDRRFWYVADDKSVIKPLTHYTPGDAPLQAFITQCLDSQRRKFPGKGRALFETFTRDLIAACAEGGVTFQAFTWDKLCDLYKYAPFQDGFEEDFDLDDPINAAQANLSFFTDRPPIPARYTCVAEMEVSDEPITLTTTLPSATLGTAVGSPSSGMGHVSNILTLMKRSRFVTYDPEREPLVSLLSSPTTNNYLTYFSSLYRMWGGAFILSGYGTGGTRTVTTCISENSTSAPGPITDLAALSLDPGSTSGGYMPKTYGGARGVVISSVLPCKTPYNFLLIPHGNNKSLDIDFYNPGWFSSQAEISTIRTADGFRLGGLTQVPPLRVVAGLFQHVGGDAFFMPTNLILIDGGSFRPSITTSDSIGYNNTTPYTPGPVIITSYNDYTAIDQLALLSAGLSDKTLVSLGFAIRPGQTRVYSGLTAVINVDLSSFVRMASSPKIVLHNDGATNGVTVEALKATPNPAGNKTYFGPAGREYLTSDFFILDSAEWNRDDVRRSLFAPTGLVPLVDATLSQTYVLRPNPEAPVDFEGTLIRPINHALAFYAVPAPPLEVKYHAEMDSGVVIDADAVEAKTPQVFTTQNGERDSQMDFPGLAKRPQVVDKKIWDASMPTGHVVAQYLLPWDLIVSDTIAAPYRTFLYSAHDSIDITITVQSNSFQAGMLVAYAVPMTDATEITTTHTNSLTSQTTLPTHMLVPAGVAKSYTLNVPWVYPTAYLDVSRLDIDPVLSIVQISVFSPLNVGADATLNYADLTISAQINGAHFSVPAVTPPVPVDVVQTTRRRLKRTPVQITSLRDLKVYDRITGVAESALIDLGLKAVAGLVHKAVDFGAAALGQAIGGAFFDYPNNSMNPPLVRTILEPHMASMEGLSTAEALDEEMGRQYSFEAAHMVPDELDFAALAARRSYNGRFNLTVSDPVGTLLWQQELTPTAGLSALPLGAIFQPTLPEFLSLSATFWSCDSLEYTFILVGASLHSTRIGFVTNYGRYVVPSVEDEAYSQFAQFHDFSAGDNSFTLSVPWRAPTDVLRVSKGVTPDRAKYSYGSVYARVVTSLQATETVAQSVEVLVFVSIRGLKLYDFSTGPSDFQLL